MLPQRLSAPEPGWHTGADVIVVGSGIAGLTTALRARAAGKVLVVTKDTLSAGSTQWAQGGIAAAIGPGDTPEQHLNDTLVAGAGLCSEEAVRVLVTEGPEALRELIELGAHFDTGPEGRLMLTREGGHHRDRIVHAGGDATGAEIQRALIAAVSRAPEIEVIEHAMVIDLLLSDDGAVAGLTLHVMGEGQRDGVGAVLGRAVVLSSGGMGQVFAATTNPAVATGDGMALAWRAGAVLRDVEFVQFHPTVLYLGEDARGQQPLVSEAVRGEGAHLVDFDGVRFMQGVHELADLAPRDVVAKAIMRRMHEQDKPHMWLDARDFGDEVWQTRFPTILQACRGHGIDPVAELIPVAPACHYASGGVAADLWGRTSVPGLYACGEVACSGVHGANRLASNSLLEGLVFARRIAADIAEGLPPQRSPRRDGRPSGLADPRELGRLRHTMSEYAGVLRTAGGLRKAEDTLAELASTGAAEAGVEAWQAANLLTVSAALVAAARLREETRGSHWREDYPDRDDREWFGHLDSVAAPVEEGVLVSTTFSRSEVRRLDARFVDDLVRAAVEEDLDGGVDVTSAATITADARAWGDFVVRADGVLAGVGIAEAVMRAVVGEELQVERRVIDGARVRAGDVVLSVHGPTRALLTGERTALNFLCHMSGVATLTRRWVDEVVGTRARIRDTRKTTPLLRPLEKYAVRCGGGVNHRASLSDVALVKDNHVLAAGGVAAAYRRVREAYPAIPVQVEVDSLDQALEAIDAGATLLLLDNMTTDQLRAAVEAVAGRAMLEASGGLSLDRAREVAETGVDYLAIGALTHSAPALDIALDLRP